MVKEATAFPMPKDAPTRRWSLRRQRAVEGYLYITPWLLGFVLFTAFPMLASLYLSFTTYSGVGTPKFVGLKNFGLMFGNDFLFPIALYNTVYFVLLSVPLGLLFAFLLAVLVNRLRFGANVYRTLFFLPSITPVVATVILWVWIFHPQFGLLNYLLSLVNIDGPAWLASARWAKPALIIMGLWSAAGGGQMIIFLAGLQNIPQELYDAAAVDGANSWVQMRHITLPMISPTMFLNLILGIIASFQVFTAAYVATEGGPAYSTHFFVLHIFFQAFRWSEMGYASALAWVLFIILLLFTLLQFRLANRWVHYEGG